MSGKRNNNQTLMIVLFMIFITFLVATVIVPNASINISASGRATTGNSTVPTTGEAVIPVGAIVVWMLPLAAIISLMVFFVVKNIEKMHQENLG